MVAARASRSVQAFETVSSTRELPLSSQSTMGVAETPDRVKVTFLGPRRAFYFFNEKEVEIFLKIPEARKGLKTVDISESSLKFPKDISLENIEPRRVLVRIDSTAAEER